MNRLPGPLHPGRERAPASRAMRARGGPARPVASLAAIALMAGSIATALPTRALAATPLTSGQAEAVVQAYGQAVVSAREPSSVITAAGGCPPVFAAPSLPLELRRGPAAAYVLGVARGQTIHDPTHIISPAELFNAYEDERNAWSDTYWDLAAPQGTSSAPVLVPGSVFSPSDPLHLIPADKWYDPGVVASPDFVNWETARIRDFPYGFAAPLAPGFNWTTARIDRWELRRAVLYMYTGLDAGPPGPSFPTPGRSARFGPAATYDQAFQSLSRRQVADAVMALEVGRDVGLVQQNAANSPTVRAALHSDAGPFAGLDPPIATAPCGVGDTGGSHVVASFDPNDIYASPAGVGAAAWIPAGQALTYLVDFQNSPKATAPATNVRVVLHLDPGLDPATVQPGDSSFARTEFSFDPSTATVTWLLPGIDLPPDTSAPDGEGWVSFTATPKAGLATGTTISESAQVFFDYNPPITTPAVVRTIDATAPVVTFAAMPATEPAGPVTVSWSVYSPPGVSGYTVLLSTDGGPLQPWDATSSDSVTLDAQAGHTYGLAVQATDVAGLTSPLPAVPMVRFTVPPAGQTSSGIQLSPPSGGGSGPSVGGAGGTLTTADGSFSLPLPSGAIAAGVTLNVVESGAAPAHLPPETVAASAVFTLLGAGLAEPETATIRYESAALGGLSSQRLSVYRQERSGAWTFVPTAVNPGAGTVAFWVTGPETVVVLAATRRFPDVPGTYWARGAIDRLLAAGVVQGLPNGAFVPGGAVSRAEFVKMLDQALGLQASTGSAGFRDVPAHAWYAPYVAAAVQAGLVHGLTPTRFGPNQAIARQEMAVLLARALKLQAVAVLRFRDASRIAPWAVQGVEAAVAAGYFEGFPGGSFQPQGTTTRAQAAKVLARVIGHEASVPPGGGPVP